MGLTGAAKTLCLPFEDTIKAQRLPDVRARECTCVLDIHSHT